MTESSDFRRVFIAAALIVAGPFALPADAQVQLPPGAQPGATQPRDLPPSIIAPQQPFAFRIPPVLERPLGADEGARVFVRAFELRGILQDPARPMLGAQARARVEREFRESLELIESERLERQRLTEVGVDGFTPEERQRIVEFMSRQISGISPEQRLADYQRFVDELGLARLERQQGLTIGQIQQVADAVTALYQEAGFFLARAIVPAQDVVDGIVVIQVLEGRMGRALAENNTMYSDSMLVRPFAGLEGELITIEAMENALLTLSDYPGLQAFGTFRPGREVGTADIIVNVQNEKRFAYSLRADNFGTAFTGEQRFAGTVEAFNLLGRGDTASLTAMQTFEPQNTTLGQFTYRLPLDDPRNRLILDLQRNAFDVTGDLFPPGQVTGLSTTGSLMFERAFARGRQFNAYGQFDFARKRGEVTQFGNLASVDDLAVLGFQIRWDRIIAESNSLASGFLRVDQGIEDAFGAPSMDDALTPGALPQPLSRVGAGPEFTKFTAGYSRLKQINDRHSLLFRLSGQWTNDLLTSMEQFSVGGSSQVRALPVSKYLGDKGVFGSAEWVMRIGRNYTVSLFHDRSVAWTNEALRVEDERFSAGGNGVSLGFTIWRITGKIQHALLVGGERLGTDVNDPNRIEDDSQTWVELSFRF
ncbi:MAG: hypothetical protein LC632_08770 [Xanthomonadaceae bacterium]|nr:hypothetical protein [Xanthomonadaceae bacterium]